MNEDQPIQERRQKRTDRRAGADRRGGADRRRGSTVPLPPMDAQTEALYEFVAAVDEYKRINERPFPSWSEVFEIIHYLGYRKVEPVEEPDDSHHTGEVTEDGTPIVSTPSYTGPDRRKKRRDRRSVVDRRTGMDRRRGPGRRRGEVRRAAEEGEICGELFNFVQAVDDFKRTHDRPHPSWSEVFRLVLNLGYRKIAPKAVHINTACGAEALSSPGGQSQ